MKNAQTLTAADLAAFASILVAALAYHGVGNTSWWTARAAESYPVGSSPEAFAPHVVDAARDANRLMEPGPQGVCWEMMPDGSAPVRLSFNVLVF